VPNVGDPIAYLYLAGLSFLGATVAPVFPEPLLLALAAQGTHTPWLLVLVTTMGGTLGSLTNYWLGRRGGEMAMTRARGATRGRLELARRLYARYGVPSLLLTWIPLIGDALAMIGGVFKTPIGTYCACVAAGKLARYTMVVLFATGHLWTP
jgi:membrane protein YqaA with SNARE-associated domain